MRFKAKFLLIFSTIILAVACDEMLEQGEPVQLLNFDSANKSVILAEGTLERLFLDPLVADREVVVISIAGALRKGKSFLLNYMLRFLYANYRSTANPTKVINETEAANWLGDENEPLRGFSWKSSTKRETTGILFWSDVFLYDSPTGDRIAIYLVDTQGLFDHLSTPTDNIRIFALSALISSVQLMNIFNVMQESDIEYLQYATEVARFTAVDDESIKPFQKLIFVIRDWGSPDEYEYGFEGGTEFIRSFLKIRDFHTEELRKVRQHMAKTFDSVEGFLMPHPGKTVARNASFDGHWGAIDEDFVETLRELVPRLLSPRHLVTKSVNGVGVRALELSVHIQQYVDLFKSESLPEAKSIYESTLDNQFQILMGKSVELYLESIQLYQEKIVNVSEIAALHNVSKTVSLRYFDEERKFGNEDESRVYRDELDAKLEKAYDEWRPITEEFLKSIAKEREQVEKQKALAEKALERDMKAKKEVEVVDKKHQELLRQLQEARYDTVESRREAERTKVHLQQIERERNEALARQDEQRRQYEMLCERNRQLEMQIHIERQQAQEVMNRKMQKIRKRDGFGKFFSDTVMRIGIAFYAITHGIGRMLPFH